MLNLLNLRDCHLSSHRTLSLLEVLSAFNEFGLYTVSPLLFKGSVQTPTLRPAAVHQSSVCSIQTKVGVLSVDEVSNPR